MLLPEASGGLTTPISPTLALQHSCQPHLPPFREGGALPPQNTRIISMMRYAEPAQPGKPLARSTRPLSFPSAGLPANPCPFRRNTGLRSTMDDNIINLNEGWARVREEGIIPFINFIETTDKEFFRARDFVTLYE